MTSHLPLSWPAVRDHLVQVQCFTVQCQAQTPPTSASIWVQRQLLAVHPHTVHPTLLVDCDACPAPCHERLFLLCARKQGALTVVAENDANRPLSFPFELRKDNITAFDRPSPKRSAECRSAECHPTICGEQYAANARKKCNECKLD